MKKVAKPKDDAIVEIPSVVGIDPIRIEPQLAIVVALDIPHVRIAIRIG